MKKLWRFLGSMQFAILLLVILAAACAGGSFIRQGLSYEEYAALYSPRTAGLILALRLDDVFHCWWFLLLTAFLCGNLLLCNLTRLPQLLRRSRQADDPAHLGAPTVCVQGLSNPDALFAALHMPPARQTTDATGSALRISVKNRLGLWGAWVCHLGIFLLILGFALGQTTREEYTVYGVPGQTRQVGDTDYAVAIRDFRIDRRADGTVEQYTAELTVLDRSNPDDILAQDVTASVNHPGSAFGFKLYQNSTGEAARLTVRKDGQTVQEAVLCVGERMTMLDTPLSVLLRDVLSDDDAAADSSTTPGYAYLICIGDELYDRNIRQEGEAIPDFQPYEVFFSQAQHYTLIQMKRDRFTPFVLLGGLLTLLGLFLAFYLQTRKVWAVQAADGSWTLCGSSPKGGALFAAQFREAAQQVQPQGDARHEVAKD